MGLTAIVISVLALYLFQLFLQETSRFHFDLWAIMGNRDNPPELSVIAGRLERAKNNMLEALPLFLGLALLAIARGDGTAQISRGALIFLVARAAYVPAYVSGIPVLRSLIWLASIAGLALMAAPQL